MKKVVPYCVTIVFAIVLFTGTQSFAQGPPPHPPGLVPIDGGVVFLLVSGLVLGVNNLRKRKE